MIEQPAWSPSLRLTRRQLPLLVVAVALLVPVLAFPKVGGPAALVLVAAGAAWWWRRDRRREERLRAFAAARGWTLAERDDRLPASWTTAPLDEGRNRRAENVLGGRVGGRRLLACDFRCTVDAFGRPTSVRYAVFTTPLEGAAALPALAVVPAPRPLLGPDPWAGPFERAFTVSCADPRFAAAVLTAALKRFLLEEGLGVGWQLDGGALVAWRPGRLDPRKLEREGRFLAQLADDVSAAIGSVRAV